MNDPTPPSRQPAGPIQRRRRRRRRWPLLIVLLLVLLAGLVALGPTLASSQPGKTLIESRLGSRLHGQAFIEDLEVGWFSDLELTGLTLIDARSREVARVPRVRRQGGLLGLLMGGQVGSVTVEKPEITLYIDRDGRISLSEIFAEFRSEPGDPAESLRKLVDARIELALRQGRVRVIRETGGQIDFSDIALTASPAALSTTLPSTLPAAAGRLGYSLTGTLIADLPPSPPAEGAPQALAPGAHVELAVDTTGAIGPDQGGLGVDHRMVLKDLVLTRGRQVFRPGEAVIRTNLVFRQQDKSLLLRDASLESQPLRVQLAGQVLHYDTEARADLTGMLSGDGEAITRHVRMLAGQEDFSLAMDPRRQYPFRLAGPLRRPELWQTDGLSGGAELGWETLTAGPIRTGKLDLQLQFQGDRIVIQPTAVPVNEGNVRLAGHVALTDPRQPGSIRPVFHLRESTAVVDRLAINEDISTALLSRINPAAFYRPQEIRGLMTVVLEDVQMPLGPEAMKTGRIGRGRIDLADLTIRPGSQGVLARLLGLLGGAIESAAPVQIPGADFRVADGRVHYDDFRLVWANLYDLKFSGSVGLDGSVEMVAGLPVTPGLVRQMLDLPPLPGAAEQLVQALGRTYVPVRLRGTRQNIQMDTADVRAALTEAMKNLLKAPGRATGSLRGVLEGALGIALPDLGGALDGEAAPQRPGPSTRPAETQPGRPPLLEAMEDLFGPVLPEQPGAATTLPSQPADTQTRPAEPTLPGLLEDLLEGGRPKDRQP